MNLSLISGWQLRLEGGERMGEQVTELRTVNENLRQRAIQT